MNHPKIDRIIRSRRRTFSIEIERDGSLTVRVPKRTSMKSIMELVERKRSWIERKQRQAQERLARTRPREFKAGEQFLYLGHPFKLRLDGNANSPLAFNNKDFVLSKDHLKTARKVFIEWYISQAQGVISESAEHYSRVSGIKYDRVKMSKMRNLIFISQKNPFSARKRVLRS